MIWALLWSVAWGGPEEEALRVALASEDADAIRTAAELLLAREEREREGEQAWRRATAQLAPAWLSEAQDALYQGEAERALVVLAPLQGTDAWETARPFWDEAVELHVRRAREAAGRRYLASRREQPFVRLMELRAVRSQLEELLQTFPESGYSPALARDLERVERELELVEPPV